MASAVVAKERTMARHSKALLAVAAVGMVMYLVSTVGRSTAQDIGAAAEERFAGATISLEAVVVTVGVEALEEVTGSSDVLDLASVPAGKVLALADERRAEVALTLKLVVGNASVGEITTEQNDRAKEKDQKNETGEYEDREVSAAFQVETHIVTASKIALEFSFKQIVAEKASSGSDEGELEEEVIETFEVSSRLALRAGRPRVAGAEINEDAAKFLILRADI
jgi:hypothetical protein